MKNQPLAIEVKDLTRKFDDKSVLRGIELTISSGEIVALKGHNGSGKTTLLRILATLTLPTSGVVRVFGHCSKNEAAKIRQHLAWVPSTDGGFAPRLTGEENLVFFGQLSGLGQNRIREHLNRWREWQGLQLALATPYRFCSSGMRQSLLLARALLQEPDILLLDEPTRSLDQESTQQFQNFLLSEAKGKTIIFSAHQEDMDAISHRQLHLREGALA